MNTDVPDVLDLMVTLDRGFLGVALLCGMDWTLFHVYSDIYDSSEISAVAGVGEGIEDGYSRG